MWVTPDHLELGPGQGHVWLGVVVQGGGLGLEDTLVLVGHLHLTALLPPGTVSPTLLHDHPPDDEDTADQAQHTASLVASSVQNRGTDAHPSSKKIESDVNDIERVNFARLSFFAVKCQSDQNESLE